MSFPPSSCRLAIAISIAILPVIPARAAPTGQAATLDTVVVTAAPVSPLTFELDPRQPRQPVPASDGADYLKTIPGFSAVRNGGTNGDPVLRGMFGSRLNLLSNDGAMPGACPARMDNPLSYVSPETYDQLIVIKGPQTVLWGPGASAGTVRFRRDTPHFDQADVQTQGSLLGGSHGRSDQVLGATAGNQHGYLRFDGNHSRADDYRDGDGNRVPSAWDKWNTDAALGWTPDADTLLEVTAGAGDGEARYAGRGMDGSQFKRSSYGLRFEKGNIGPVLKALQANVYYNDADHVMDNYSLRDPNPMSMMPMPMAANVDRRTQGGRLAAQWQWTQLSIDAGIDGQNSRHRQRSASERGSYRQMPWSTDAEFDNVGLFSEATWAFNPLRRLVTGARVDRARVTDKRQTIAGMGMGMPMANPSAGQTREETLPSGFVRLEQDSTDGAISGFIGVGHSERMPDYWELFSPDQGPADSVNAFSALQPEKTTQLDVGAQYHSPKLDAWVSAYAGRVQDFILFRYMPGGMMGRMSSDDNIDARIHGGEAGLQYRPAQNWKLEASMSQAWGENRDEGRPLPQMPPLESRISLAYDNQRWNAGALLRVVAGQSRVAVGEGNVVGSDLGPSPGFATLAINGGYRFNDHWWISAGIDNLFDRNYSEHLNLAGNTDFGYPADAVRINEPGRTGWLKLNFSYQ
ncbi:TonB-dependent copper receptor [Pseudoxanthomonas dokdonensis]|uniref:TonB-dependent receptor n=1 Tax=Pseudoxanthomonas dokdonensis TaxID=344882 RepID=A0A0R0CQ02_9GAMM|nr:TonB-dependent copper receptor [Pseudoxanthomonas dokdonensis]KRG71951.1 TonB-dependent receptor [Pseudoxanthomonas dokdonensis]